MAGKPRVVNVKEGKRKPRVVREEDYSMVLSAEKKEEPEHVVFKGLRGKSELLDDEKEGDQGPVAADTAAEKLRKQALQDITPLDKGKVREIQDQVDRQKGGVGRRVKKFLGME